jgi:uncharacterized protein YcbK (DUF882 family)
MEKLSRHVSVKEATCRDGCGECNVDLAFLANFDEWIKKEFDDAAVNVHCVCRCPAHNRAVGGAFGSLHISDIANGIKARAIDFHIPKYSIKEVIERADKTWHGGVELGTPTWIHVDGGRYRRFKKK